ncbi:MAG: MATE family efflux transporter [Clostridia bacterium]|nr:MATE family efflux transporter [Clostridia bacterium]
MPTAVRRAFGGKRHERDMTEGSIAKNLWLFALPLMVGNLFQQLYNMVDTWVIGQTGNGGAFAAVGNVGPIINILIGLFSGLASGAGVVISRYFGAHEREKLSRAVHTAVAMTLLLAAVFTVLGVLLTPAILRLMLGGEENEVFAYAKEYLTIYFSGLAGLLLYNMGAGILRAVGDSRHPFYFLLVSAVANIVLDLLFVFALGMGVAGVALATVISQALSALLTVLTLLRTPSDVRVRVRAIRLDPAILWRIVVIGIPAALQLALTAFSNVFVQSYIAGVNVSSVAEQTAVLGGWTTYSKIDQFLFLPSQSLSLAATTFVGQNLGAGNVRRARRGVLIACLSALAVTLPAILILMLFAPALAGIFHSDPEIVRYASLLLHYLTPFYIFTCLNQTFASGLRGAGNSTAPMLIMLLSFVGFRQLYLFIVSSYISNDLLPIAFSYPAGWAVCCLSLSLYYAFYKFKAEPTAKKEKDVPAV